MSKIEIGLGSLHIDASVIAQGLALEPSLVQAMMRKGEITSLCERGVALCSTLPASEDNNHAQDRRGITGSGAWDRFEGRDD